MRLSERMSGTVLYHVSFSHKLEISGLNFIVRKTFQSNLNDLFEGFDSGKVFFLELKLFHPFY